MLKGGVGGSGVLVGVVVDDDGVGVVEVAVLTIVFSDCVVVDVID